MKTGNIPQSNALSETRGYWIEKYFHLWIAVNQLICWIKMESYYAMCSSVGFPRNSVHSISAKKNKILKVKFGSAMIPYRLNDENPHICDHVNKSRAYTYRYTYVLPSLTVSGARMKHWRSTCKAYDRSNQIFLKKKKKKTLNITSKL
jgi:hypothetical protein